MIEEGTAILLIYASVAIGAVYTFVNFIMVKKAPGPADLLDMQKSDDDKERALLEGYDDLQLQKLNFCAEEITKGAIDFLSQEYSIMGIFVAVFSVIILSLVEEEPWVGPWTTIPFILGCLTSMFSGYIGMRMAVYTNSRTAIAAKANLRDGFMVAYRGGAVLGFGLVSAGLLVLVIIVNIYSTGTWTDKAVMFDAIAGYGLGGSSIALFGRVGGGIYTKAADVGADLCGKVENSLAEDSIKNPGTIADNVGDNVGDIAGMGADLFGSFAESSCAAMVCSAASPELVASAGSLYYPLLITATGIIACMVASMFAAMFSFDESDEIKMIDSVQRVLKWQLILSTVLTAAGLYAVTYWSLPETFKFMRGTTVTVESSRGRAFTCVLTGLISGCIIGFVTEYYTSYSYHPVQEVSDSTRTGAATNIIYGLALGYMSTIIPVICISITVYISFKFAGMYGIGLAALGILSILTVCLSIDGYGPIADNAGGITEMAGFGEEVRVKTDALDAAGNTTAAIGKGFAIASAALVALALFGAYVTRSGQADVNILQPVQFAGLIFGAMLPYAFSALTMKAVGKAAKEMVEEIRRQFDIPEAEKARLLDEGDFSVKPEYDRCIKVATTSSLKEMIAPGCLVMFTPLLIGSFVGMGALSGVLSGAIASGVQMAISSSNTGGAWDNAKKYIEAGRLLDKDGNSIPKGTEEHKAAVVGDTVGDPLKDTSGPSLNILVKLMSIISLVFVKMFIRAKEAGLNLVEN